MGLFQSNEEKRIKAEEKKEKELRKLVSKYNLGSMSKTDLETLRRISSDLAGNAFAKAGMAFSFAKVEEQAKVTYLSALVEQNWLIIKMLSEMNRKLDVICKDKQDLS